MRLLVWGCGSIGTRRAKLLAWMGHEVDGYDLDPLRAAKATEGHAVSLQHIERCRFGTYDAVLICTPPGSGRLEQVGRALGIASGVFVEKPLALTRAEVEAIAQLPMSANVTMGACNLRFACKLQQKIEVLDMPWKSMKFEMRQHAKHWSKQHQPISLVLDSIHELDLAIAFQGPIEEISGSSSLDHCNATVKHAGGGVSLIEMDRVTTPPERFVTVTDAHDEVHKFSVDTYGMYRREMEHFVEHIKASTNTCNSLACAAETCLRAMEIM